MSCYQHQGANPGSDRTCSFLPATLLSETSLSANRRKKRNKKLLGYSDVMSKEQITSLLSPLASKHCRKSDHALYSSLQPKMTFNSIKCRLKFKSGINQPTEHMLHFNGWVESFISMLSIQVSL